MTQKFAKTYFDDKPLEGLKKSITPAFTEKNTNSHLALLDVPPGIHTVLEVGCGIGRLLLPISKLPGITNCYGVDASRRMIEEAFAYCGDSSIYFSWCSPNGIFQVPEEKIDFAFAWTVFQHIDDTPTVIEYCKTMIKSLGVGGMIKCQFLTHDERPESPLWAWHDLTAIEQVMASCECGDVKTVDITPRWSVVSGIKQS